MKSFIISFALLFISFYSLSQSTAKTSAVLPFNLEELTAPDFEKALAQSGGICIIPIGIIEKHGPHLPLGTDLLDVREACRRAVSKEYAIVFPHYYFGQINEARHQPGTIAYSPELVWNILEETCDELSRNGITKIILVNGHGGNDHFLPYFCQAQLASSRNYAVYFFTPEMDEQFREKYMKLKKTTTGGHADEDETSMLITHRPDLVHLDRAGQQSGEDLNRLNIPYTYTGIWWYAKYPNHYAGDGRYASEELGNLILNGQADQLAEMIRIVKSNNAVIELQNKFYQQSLDPLKTEQ